MIDIRDRLLAAFEAERQDHLAQMRVQLARLREGGRPDVRDLFRRAHSLKGAARAVDLADVEGEAHALESLLDAIVAGTRPLDRATGAEIEAALDRIEGDQAAAEDVEGQAAAPTLVRVQHDRVRALADAAARVTEAASAGTARASVEEAASALAHAAAEADAAGVLPLAQALVRHARTLAATARRLGEGDAAIARALDSVDREARALMMAPAGEMLAGLERMVRELATGEGKHARLAIVGAEIEADRRILEALRDPVVHLLRNAVAHGIETPAARARAGKPAEATVRIDVSLERGELEVAVCDDGRGLDRAAVARATGGRADEPDDILFGRLFGQGVSTAASVGRVAGRGVGLAVVADAARALGGHASIAPGEGGRGTCARIRVPRAAVRQAVLDVVAGGERFTLPARAVSRVVRIDTRALVPGEGGTVATLFGETVPIPAAELGALLGLAPGTRGEVIPALVLGTGRDRLLLLVDELEAVTVQLVRPSTEVAFAPPSVAGFVLEADGAVVPVLDPAALVAAARHRGHVIEAAPAMTTHHTPTILVVDDSITTRTLQRSILEGQGYRVELAVDGLDGLERLRAAVGTIDLLLVDVEMPRLDGFGLLNAVRNDPAVANIPVIMMTSRNSAEDVRRGLELGASAYLTKQAFDAGALLSAVARFV